MDAIWKWWNDSINTTSMCVMRLKAHGPRVNESLSQNSNRTNNAADTDHHNWNLICWIFGAGQTRNKSLDLKCQSKTKRKNTICTIFNNSNWRFDVRVHYVCNTVLKLKPNEQQYHRTKGKLNWNEKFRQKKMIETKKRNNEFILKIDMYAYCTVKSDPNVSATFIECMSNIEM